MSQFQELGPEEYAALWGCDPAYDHAPREQGDGYLFYNFAVVGWDVEFLQRFIPAIERTIAGLPPQDTITPTVRDLRDEDEADLQALKAECETRLRKGLIEALLWNHGGTTANRISDGLLHGPQLKSCVAVCGPASDYTTDELVRLAEFSRVQTQDHIRVCGEVRAGDNLICIGKMSDGSWLRKRLTWEIGSMYAPTLAEAMAAFEHWSAAMRRQ